MKKFIVSCFMFVIVFTIAGCSTVLIEKDKKKEVNKPNIIKVEHYHYFIVLTKKDTKDLKYNHKKHTEEAGYNFEHDHKKQRGHIGPVSNDCLFNADHRKQRGRTAPSK